MSMRFVLSTGGTGGHIFPALAVAEKLKKACPDAQILFMGGTQGPEGRLCAQAGVDFQGIAVQGLFGRGLKALPAAWAMFKGISEAGKVLRNFRPHAVAGFGGYAAFATLFAAARMGLPTMIHEQNARPGMANRVLGKMVHKVCLGLPDQDGMFPKAKCVLTGNPIRADIAALGNVALVQDSIPCLLIMGGSQGARAINSLIVEYLAPLRDAGIALIHQTGKSDYSRVLAAYQSHGMEVMDMSRSGALPEDLPSRRQALQSTPLVAPFLDNMPVAYATATAALCRSGASTVAELAAAGKPAILIPFPYATHDHQTQNALSLVMAEAAMVFQEKDFNDLDKPLNMGKVILDFLQNKERLNLMSQAALAQAHPLAAEEVSRMVLQLAQTNSPNSLS